MSKPSMSFTKAARHTALGLLASAALGTVATPAAAQEAGAPAPSGVSTTTTTARDGTVTTTTFDQNSCVETVSSERRNNGLFGIIGASRRSESSRSYNAECGRDARDAALAYSLLTATRTDGSPDMPMRAAGLEMYRNSSDQGRQRIDTLLAAAGTNYAEIVFSTTPTGASALCVRQPATRATPATDANTPARVSVSFRCTLPGAAPTTPVSPLAIGTTTDTTAVTAAADTTATAETTPPPPAAAAAAPRP